MGKVYDAVQAGGLFVGIGMIAACVGVTVIGAIHADYVYQKGIVENKSNNPGYVLQIKTGVRDYYTVDVQNGQTRSARVLYDVLKPGDEVRFLTNTAFGLGHMFGSDGVGTLSADNIERLVKK